MFNKLQTVIDFSICLYMGKDIHTKVSKSLAVGQLETLDTQTFDILNKKNIVLFKSKMH